MENNKHDAIIRKESEALMKRPEPMEMIVVPVADVFETADAFVVKLDVPGTTKESIDLSIEPNQLTVKATIGVYFKNDMKVLFSEIGRKRYLREFHLGDGIDHEKIVAQFEDGVLTITLPKTDEVKPKEIPIR
jgi:HSP20 family protein